MGPFGIVNDRVTRIGTLQAVRLHRTCVMLAVRSVTNKRTSPVDLQSGIADDHRGAGYGLSALTVMLLT